MDAPALDSVSGDAVQAPGGGAAAGVAAGAERLDFAEAEVAEEARVTEAACHGNPCSGPRPRWFRPPAPHGKHNTVAENGGRKPIASPLGSLERSYP